MQASLSSSEKQQRHASRLRVLMSRYGASVVVLSFALLFIFFGLAAPNFFSPLAISNIISFTGVIGIITVGAGMLMISGEFDLSVGSVLAVGGFVFALTLNAGLPPIGAALAGVASGALLGLLNGVIVAWSGIPSFIATLGTMLAYRGIARVLGGGDFAKYTGPKTGLFELLNGPVAWLNSMFTPAANFRMSIVWFMLIAVIVGVTLARTAFGNWIYAVGGNRDAARAQGVPVTRVKLISFMLVGMLAAFAGVVQFAERGSIDPLRGMGWELIAVVACVLGGIQLTGGSGTILGAVVGVFLLQMLEQGLVLMGISVQVFRAIVGFILILTVIFNSWLSRTE